MAKSYGRIYQNKSNVSITPFDIYNLYPVGSIYMSVNSTNPSNYFGGTWEQIKDRFLLGAGSTYSNGATGGEATHKLTVNELPKHRHDINYGSTAGGDGSGFRFSNTTGKGSYFMGYVGGDQPHNNMPPYLVVYMWKRVA